MTKMKKIAAMTAALLISASTLGYMPQDSIKISNVTANAAKEEITSVEINETNFPDAIFREYVKSSFDKDGDGVLSAEEIAAVTKLYVRELDISDLTGVQYFKNLKELACNNNEIIELDLSNNTALEYLNCNYNKLTSLDLSNNTALIELYCTNNNLSTLDLSNNKVLRNLWCDFNNLTSLDVSNNIELEELCCTNNQLSIINVSNNRELKELRCNDNQLAIIDLSKCPELTRFECNSNQLTSLDLSNNPALTFLICYHNQLTSLDVSEKSDLRYLSCYLNQLTSIDVSNNSALEFLDFGNNQLTSLDVSTCTALTELRCYSNQLTSLDLSKNTKLIELDYNNNKFTSIDVSQNTALTTFSGNYHEYEITLTDNTFDLSTLPTGFDVTKASEWTNGTVEGNILTIEDTSNEVTYKYDCGNGHSETFTLVPQIAEETTSVEINEANFPDAIFRKYVTNHFDINEDMVLSDEEIDTVITIDFGNHELCCTPGNKEKVSDLKGVEFFTSLKQLYFENNNISEIDLSKNTELIELNCKLNDLTSLDVSANVNLTTLNCCYNDLTALDVTKNTKLKNLYCYENKITQLDVSNNPDLRNLDCSNNELTALDVSNNPLLDDLHCGYNHLTILDLSNNTELTVLHYSENNLTSLDLSNNDKINFLYVDRNTYPITVVDNKFDLSTLPGNFDITKATEWIDGEVEGNILTVSDTEGAVYYIYDCGNNETAQFAFYPITFVNSSTTPETTTATTTPTTTTTTFAPPSYSCSLSVYPYDEADTIYEIGEELDYSTICVHGYGTMTSFGSTSYMDIPYMSLADCSSFVTVDASEFDNTKPGTYTIYVEWYNAKDSFEVTVIDPDNPTAIPGVEINETNFPDSIFRQYIAEKYDDDNDGTLSYDEMINVTQLLLRESGVSDLTGLQYFKNLAILDCAENNLTQLDISENTALTHLYCSDNNLTNLDISNNVILNTLSCYNNKLTKLDLSSNSELGGVWCSNNQLTSLDVSHNTLLTDLLCSNNQLASVDLSNTICIKNGEWGTVLNGNKHKIALTNNTFDLSTLPAGFDVSKASDWTNATVEGNILTIEDITKEVTYTYDCGLGFSDTFTLVPQIAETPAETTTTTAAPETTITTTAITTVTTTTAALVTTTTPDEDLPQTGFSNLYNCIPFSAGALVLLGMYAVKKSRKEDEE